MQGISKEGGFFKVVSRYFLPSFDLNQKQVGLLIPYKQITSNG